MPSRSNSASLSSGCSVKLSAVLERISLLFQNDPISIGNSKQSNQNRPMHSAFPEEKLLFIPEFLNICPMMLNWLQ